MHRINPTSQKIYAMLHNICMESTFVLSLDSSGRTLFLHRLYEAVCAKRRLRMGIMGGTFDPIHYGHLVTGDQALHQYKLDLVIYLVASQPALKQDCLVTDARCRLRMARMALSDNDRMVASSFELFRPGISYTIDTLEALTKQGVYFAQAIQNQMNNERATRWLSALSAPTKSSSAHQENTQELPSLFELTFITGLDAVCSIMLWERPQEIFSHARVVAATRPGFTPEQAQRALREVGCSDKVELMTIPALSISSTEIRTKIKNGQSVRYLLPECIMKYVHENRVYETKFDNHT